MTQMRSGPWSAPLLHLALAAIVFSVVAPLLAPVAAEAQGGGSKLVIFMPEDISGQAPEGLAAALVDASMLAMKRSGLYQPVLYSSTAPSVLRAVDEGKISREEVGTQPDARLAVKIGNALGADIVMLTKIEGYTETLEPASVTVTFSGTLYRVAENMDPEALEPKAQLTPEKTFATRGVSKSRAGYRGSLEPLRAEAVQDAVAKAGEALTGVPVERKAPVRKKAVPNWALWLIGAGILVALINSGGGGGTTAADLPQNLRLSSDGTSVLLQWDPPTAPREQIAAYRIYRRAATETTFTQIAEVAGDQITYSDFDIEGGAAYTYQMSVVYTTLGETQRVTFRTISIPTSQL